jgi:hypothetical protein
LEYFISLEYFTALDYVIIITPWPESASELYRPSDGLCYSVVIVYCFEKIYFFGIIYWFLIFIDLEYCRAFEYFISLEHVTVLEYFLLKLKFSLVKSVNYLLPELLLGYLTMWSQIYCYYGPYYKTLS